LLLAYSRDTVAQSSAPCSFTITSSGGIACPAGQLSDGQIRLNGSEPAAIFTIVNGQITDAERRGCIITGELQTVLDAPDRASSWHLITCTTDPPTTQIQCDSGAAPAPGFSLSADGTISYNNSSHFYACPATDTEYNIYVNPDFGQTKCIPVSLSASDCGSGGQSCPSQQTSIVWTTVTSVVTQWSNTTFSVSGGCGGLTPTTTSNKSSHECSCKTKSGMGTRTGNSTTQATGRASGRF
jgi:hypothetical protein